jgi:nuclease HARBI1
LKENAPNKKLGEIYYLLIQGICYRQHNCTRYVLHYLHTYLQFSLLIPQLIHFIHDMDFEWLEDILVLGEKRIRERRNPFVLFNDNEFMDRFHFHKETAQDLLYPVLEHDTTRNYALSPDLQFLVTLRFLTCATFQGVCADLFNTHRTTISRSIHKVVHEINALRHDYIRFPDDLASVKQQFFSYGNMPGVVGCVDGTHIPIRRPSSNPEAEVFRCRKGFFSINTQVVAGPDYKFYNVVSRWPGSTHDSRIFNNSNLKTCFEDNILSGILLGDSGYPCTR